MTEGIQKLHAGDVIEACGQRAEVGEILFSHVDDGDGILKPSADVEFKDSHGNYRHWQSWSDGGRIIRQDGSVMEFKKEA